MNVLVVLAHPERKRSFQDVVDLLHVAERP